jgi:4-alpha-glucanotransferase
MNFINKIASFVVCIFVAQTSLGFAESHVDHNENDFQKNFEDATTCWLRALLKKSLQEAIYDDLEEVITQDELLSMFQDSDFQSKLRTHINLLQEYLSLFPSLSWDNPSEDRINIPGKVLSTNWTFRFRPSVETLISHQGLSSILQNLAFSTAPPTEVL